METDNALGSVQGVLLNYDTCLIDNARGYIDELMGCYLYMHGLSPNLIIDYKYVTYTAWCLLNT